MPFLRRLGCAQSPPFLFLGAINWAAVVPRAAGVGIRLDRCGFAWDLGGALANFGKSFQAWGGGEACDRQGAVLPVPYAIGAGYIFSAALLQWVATHSVHPVAEEPYVSQWNYTEKNKDGVPELVKARLDGGFHVAKGGLGFFDVVIVDAATNDAHALRERAHNEGAAAHAAVLVKLRKYPPDKYPAATLVTFAVEALGRPSEPVLQLFRDLAPTEPSERAAALKEAHYRLSTLVAMRQAELQLAAEGVGVYTGPPRKTRLYTDATKSSARPGHGPPGWAAPLGRIQ